MRDNELYVFSRRITRVDDPFAAEYLWEPVAPWSFSGRQDLLIKAALDQHPALSGPRKRLLNCFSHVRVLLPHRVAEMDRRILSDARKRELRQQLEEAHRRDLQCYLPEGVEVRYAVEGAEGLQSDEVLYMFGHAVYVPAEGETPRYCVKVMLPGGDWQLLSYIYPNQRLILINSDPYNASCSVDNWPFCDKYSILLMHHQESGEVEVVSEPEKGLTCTFESATGSHQIKDEDGNSLTLSIELFTEDIDELAKAEKAATKNNDHIDPLESNVDYPSVSQMLDRMNSLSTDAGDIEEYETFEEATITPSCGAELKLIGLLLQHLSIYQDYGVDALRIGFTADGGMVSPDDCTAVAVLKLDGEGRLIAESAAGSNLLEPPLCWKPVEGFELIIEPPPRALCRDYAAFLRLPQAKTFPLKQGVCNSLGRGKMAQIAPGLLECAQIVSLQKSSAVESAERLGFSREVARVEARPDGLQVIPGGKSPVWHLDAFGEKAQQIGKGQSLLIPSGEHLVTGHYLLKYEGHG